MLLCISHNKGCRYYLGEWKNEIFTPRLHARMNWCDQDVFAPESLLTPDGRRVMWAWCIGGGDGWNGIQSLPRELSLPEDGVLRIRPLRELEQLRQAPRREASLLVKAEVPCPLPDMEGDAIELAATFRQGEARRCGVRLLCDRNQGKGIDVMVEPRSSRLELGATTAPLELGAGEDIRLRIFVDRGIVEVFANDRQAVMRRHDYAPQDVGVCLLSEGGATEIREAVGWQMRAVDPADVQDPGSGR
jgi:sucrose-6-phosphate hydrolase SacC (GH32 family)